MKAKMAKKLLDKVIQDLAHCKWLFVNDPGKDFTRKRKLPFEQIVRTILSMQGGSIANELMNAFGIRENLPTTSAFIQQRGKILPEAFETLLHLFSQASDEGKTYEGLRLLAVDGSDFVIATNPSDTDSFFPGTEQQKPYNLLHLNAMYDLVQHVYVDAVLLDFLPG